MINLNNLRDSGARKIGDSCILCLEDENGNDWYESQKDFKNETLKIVFGSSGVIVSMSYDVSTLWPVGNSVVEVAPEDVPDNISINGEWLYKNGQILTAPVDNLKIATLRRDKEL